MFLMLLEAEVRLVPDGSIFFHIALILVMIWVLNRTLFKPINKILADREAQTGGKSGEAAAVLRQVDEKLTAYETGLRNARGDGYRMLEQARATAMEARQAELNAVKDEVAGQVAAEKDSIRSQAEAAKQALLVEANATASSISSRILGR
ncbi:MAG: ATP synthase F0 subunit B [Pyrinomonadaceae bacterium]